MIEKAICLWFLFFSSELKTKMDRLYVLEDSVKSLFWKNSKPIRSCVLGSTSHRNLRALPSRSALGCASGTTLGQRAQVSMLGRTSDAASNINIKSLGYYSQIKSLGHYPNERLRNFLVLNFEKKRKRRTKILDQSELEL